jgi:hypothetical protein
VDTLSKERYRQPGLGGIQKTTTTNKNRKITVVAIFWSRFLFIKYGDRF